MLRNKTYDIDGVKFSMREPGDFDMDEDDYIQAFFKDFYTPDSKTIAGNIKSEDLVRLFEIILIPKGKLPEDFTFRKAKRDVSTKIIADFFLNSVVSTLSTAVSLKNSMTEQLKL